MSKPEKPTFYLAGQEDGPPTLDQLVALAKRLTGRDPTPEEIEEARTLLNGPKASMEKELAMLSVRFADPIQ